VYVAGQLNSGSRRPDHEALAHDDVKRMIGASVAIASLRRCPMSRIGPSLDPNLPTAELYRESDASESRRMFAYDDQAAIEDVRWRSLLIAVAVIVLLVALVAIAR